MKYATWWIIIVSTIVLSMLIFIGMYLWISMTTDLEVYATLAGTLQAAKDYEKGEYYIYSEMHKKTKAKENMEMPIKIHEYSIPLYDISGKYGTQSYVVAYNRTMKKKLEKFDMTEKPRQSPIK